MRKAANHPAYEPYRARLAAAPPRVAVYAGEGASHSWIWFCDLLERLGIYDVSFITCGDILAGRLASSDVLLLGGGDTYAMAASLGAEGARRIEEFVRSGGVYHGSCAGAYLVLSDVDLEPFTPFALISGSMLNVMRDPPPALCLEHKYLAPYGSDWVFHPVYGEVPLEDREGALIPAPLFGGPVMRIDDSDEVVARYAGTCARAAYPWKRTEAESFIDGKDAVASACLGSGTVSVSGPHLEHPLFPAANCLIARRFCEQPARSEARPMTGRAHTDPQVPFPAVDIEEITRQVSNARIVGFGLEKLPITWQIGVKVWEPEKIRMFLDYTWDRLPYVRRRKAEGSGVLASGDAGGEPLAESYREVTELARTLRIKVESGRDSNADAALLLGRLKELTAGFLGLCFALHSEERAEAGGATR